MAEATKGTFTCEKCRRSYAWKPQLAGKRVACKCGGRINVPIKPPAGKPAESAAAAPAPPSAPKKVKSKTPPPKIKVAKTPPPPPSPSTILDNLPEESAFHSLITPGANSKRYKSAKPTALVAIGILSIAIGLVSGLAGYGSAKTWRWIYRNSVPRTMVNASEGAELPPPVFRPYSGATLRPTGFSPTQCNQIGAVTPFDGPFAEPRRDRLERLLAEAGTLILPNLASGSLRAAPPARDAGPDAPDRFLAPHGTITVHQDWAKYETENHPAIYLDKNIATINGTTYLSLQAIDQTMHQLRDKLPKITNMQLGYVADYLIRTPFDPHFANATVDDNAQNVFSTAKLGGVKILAIQIQGVDLLVLPNGRGTYKRLAPAGLDIVTNCPMFSPIVGFEPMMPGDPDYMLALSICSLVAMVLAMYLILAGITTLIWPPRWARLHMVYAILSVVLILTEGGLAFSLYTSITAKAASAANNAGDMQQLAAFSVPQIIYTLILLGFYARNPRLGRKGI